MRAAETSKQEGGRFGRVGLLDGRLYRRNSPVSVHRGVGEGEQALQRDL